MGLINYARNNFVSKEKFGNQCPFLVNHYIKFCMTMFSGQKMCEGEYSAKVNIMDQFISNTVYM